MKGELDNLERMVRYAQGDLNVRSAIQRSLILALQCLGLGLREAESLSEKQLNKPISSLVKYEREWFGILSQRGAMSQLSNLRVERANRIAATLKRYLGEAPTTILDVGCGDGLIADNLAMAGYEVSTCDLIDWRLSHETEFQRSTGGRVPYQGRRFGKALLLMVAHHASNPDVLIRETFEKADEIYIIESVTNTFSEYLYGLWFDWWYNNVLGHLKRGRIPVPCLFHTTEEWRNYIFRLTNRDWSEQHDLLVSERLNPEHHNLFVYRR